MEGMGLTPEFWKDKKVFITGHTGFKGSWLSLWLQTVGADVVGYSLVPPTIPNMFSVAKVADGMKSLEGDIRDLPDLQRAIKSNSPEIVIHMAAQSLVQRSYQSPIETYATNVMGTVNVLEVIRHVRSVKVVIIVTSDKCYENNEWLWSYRENEMMGGHDPYSSSKGCAELVTAAYRKSFYKESGCAIASVRAGNVIGGGDWAQDRLIPDMIRAITNKQAVLIRNPDAIRPWQFVLEPLNGYLTLAEKLWVNRGKFAHAWNFGPGDLDSKSVSWIVAKLTSLWGKDAKWKLDDVQYPHEAYQLMLDSSKARSILEWAPKLELTKTLAWIVDWYKAYLINADTQNFTKAQILKFQSMK